MQNTINVKDHSLEEDRLERVRQFRDWFKFGELCEQTFEKMKEHPFMSSWAINLNKARFKNYFKCELEKYLEKNDFYREHYAVCQNDIDACADKFLAYAREQKEGRVH